MSGPLFKVRFASRVQVLNKGLRFRFWCLVLYLTQSVPDGLLKKDFEPEHRCSASENQNKAHHCPTASKAIQWMVGIGNCPDPVTAYSKANILNLTSSCHSRSPAVAK